MTVRGAVFDLDHTLFDRYSTLREIMPGFCAHFDTDSELSVDQAAELITFADKNFVHLGWKLILKNLTEWGMFRNPPKFEEYEGFLLEEFTKHAVAYPFTKPMLTELREAGYKTGLITNGKSETQRAKLRMLELEPYFDEIIISGELGAHKPDPEPFWEMAKRLNVLPGELLYVGDHPLNDIEASRRAGYIPVWVMTTGTWVYPDIEKPEYQIENVSELPALISKINA